MLRGDGFDVERDERAHQLGKDAGRPGGCLLAFLQADEHGQGGADVPPAASLDHRNASPVLHI
jgi:hypothetical protein